VRMRILATLSVCLSAAGWAQNPIPVKHPQIVSPGYMSQTGATIKFASANKLTADGNAATKQQRVNSVPNFSSSFTFGGTTYPFTMVGKDPQNGGSTHVDTSLVTIQLFFDEYVDQNGNNIVIDAATVIPQFLSGPNFETTVYGTGITQFSDAIQRAEFANAMRPSWHTLIEKPRMLQPVIIEVPFGLSLVFQAGPTGPFFALIDDGFFVSQLNTIVQFEPFRVDELAFVLTRNALFYQGGDPNNCCVLGFHTALDTAVHGNRHDVQTFATASWLDAGIFSDAGRADVNFISHEITEWMNDPFVNNVVPSWLAPFSSPPVCQSVLETGDPLEFFSTNSFPVTVDGFTYHPQVEALLQWFERQVPSTAFQAAYSYPDTTLLTAPSPCPGT
jgi:hypothetical protein